MKSINIKSIITAVLMVIAGFFLVVKPSDTLDLIVKVVGIALMVVGLIGILQFMLKKDKKDRSILRLIISIVEVIGGVVFLVKPDFIVSFYYVFAGIIVLLNGINNLTVAFDMKKNRHW